MSNKHGPPPRGADVAKDDVLTDRTGCKPMSPDFFLKFMHSRDG